MWGIVIKIESSTPCISLRLLQQSYHGSTQSWISELHGQRYWTMWRFRLFIKLDTVLRSVINSFPIKKKKKKRAFPFSSFQTGLQKTTSDGNIIRHGEITLVSPFLLLSIRKRRQGKGSQRGEPSTRAELAIRCLQWFEYYQYLTEVSRVTVA